jgi:hypothetical protein
MTKPVDFLSKPSPSRLRKEIQNICDSYSHSWDLLSELCQNAVDAIQLHKKRHGEGSKKHAIYILINARERSVEVTDTGIGFPLGSFEDLLAPNGTDKLPSDPVIGQKGVGLTYTIFISNYYSIETKSVTGHLMGEIKNAAAWKSGSSGTLPMFDYKTRKPAALNPSESFTRVLVKDVERNFDEAEDMFSQTLAVLKYLVRTKTAIGNVKVSFGEAGLGIDVKITLVGLDGKEQSDAITPSYLLPEEMIAKNKAIDLDEFKQKAAMYDDRQKASQLQGKCLRKVGSINRAGRKINYYCFFAPSRKLWSEISQLNGLIFTSAGNEETVLYEGGIYTASRGMPSGIRLEAPRTGYFGYWPNFYMLLEDDSITFDLGRKSIPSRTVGLLRDLARGFFNEFEPFFQYVSSDPPVVTIPGVQHYEKTKLFEEIAKLPDLGIPSVNYLKHPDSQEAAVVALFHELLAAKVLHGYYTLKTGYKMTYDLWGMYKIERSRVGKNHGHHATATGAIELPIVIEFKYKAEDILADFESNRKFFNDLDLIVCWDFDETAFAKQGVTVEVLQPDDVFYYGSNFSLVWPGSYNLGNASIKPLLSLRKFVQDLRR